MNLFKSTLWSRLIAVILLAALSGMTGCATVSNQVYHSFSFDGWSDNPAWSKQVDLLEYGYGDKYPKVRDVVQNKKESLPYGTGVTANMTPGEFLYVKWRIKSTAEEVDVKVDLRSRLPVNMFDHRITFVIDDKQLYVYLVTPQGKKTDAPPILKTTHSRYYVTYEIYPSNTYIK